MLDTTGIVFRKLSSNSSIPFLLERALSAWKAFCELPREEKLKFSLSEAETNYWDPGYWEKKKATGSDEKEYFHIHSGIQATLARNGKNRNYFPTEAKMFLLAGEDLHRYVSKLFDETQCKLCVDKSLTDRLEEELFLSKDLLALRFLKYDTATFGEKIAEQHPDKCGLTAHLYSSHPGLLYLENVPGRQLENAELWHELEVPRGNVAFFNGSQMYDFSGKQHKPLLHKVIQTGTPQESRYSVVTFAPFLSMPRSPKNKRISDSIANYL